MAFKIATGTVAFKVTGLSGVLSGLRRIGGAFKSVFSSRLFRLGGPLAAFFGGRQVLQQAERQISATTRLAAVVAATGQAAGFTTRELVEMSQKLSRQTIFGDEAIQEAQALIATFTNIRGEVFEETLQAALDLATVMDGDLRGAALQVAKAINDPVTQLTALRRAGVSFDNDFVAMIQNLVAGGKEIEAQRRILAALREQGLDQVAQAIARTPVGKLRQMTNALGDFSESIGIGFLDRIASGFNSVTDAVTRLRRVGFELGRIFADVGFLIADIIATLSGQDLLASIDASGIQDLLRSLRVFFRTAVPFIRQKILEIVAFVVEILGQIEAKINSMIDALRALNPANWFDEEDVDRGESLLDIAAALRRQAEDAADIIRQRMQDIEDDPVEIDIVPDIEGRGRKPGLAFTKPRGQVAGATAPTGSVTDLGSFFTDLQARLLNTATDADAARAQEMIRLQNEANTKADEIAQRAARQQAELRAIREAVRNGLDPAEIAKAIGMR